jgi:hypothetical protein
MRNSDSETYDPEAYDSTAMAADIINAVGGTFNAEIGESFRCGDGEAFRLVTPRGREFLIAVRDITDHYPAS